MVDDSQASRPSGLEDQVPVEVPVEEVTRLVDITDDVKTIVTDSDSDTDSNIVERVQIHSPKMMCNASVMVTNRL